MPYTVEETGNRRVLAVTPTQVAAMNAAQSAVNITAYSHDGGWYIPADLLLLTNPGGSLVGIKSMLEACLPILENPFPPPGDD